MKNSSLQIVSLLKEKEFLEQKLKNLLYGSIEVRERSNKKYIFVHFRENDKLVTKYAGEYSDYLYRLISDNSIQAKAIKSQLRKINKSLMELGYSATPYSENASKYINYLKEHTIELIQSILYADKTPLSIKDIESVLCGEVKHLSSKDVIKVINLKNAIDFILNKHVISNKPDFNILSAINKFIEEGFIFSAGTLRTTPYTTDGRYEAPKIPTESIVKKDLKRISEDNVDPIDQAIETLLYIMKHKLFLFGNKRTAFTYVNCLLITQGEGILLMPTSLADDFKKLYIEYRDSNNDAIKHLIKDKCIVRL